MLKGTEEEKIQFVLDVLEHYKARNNYSKEFYECLLTDSEVKQCVRAEERAEELTLKKLHKNKFLRMLEKNLLAREVLRNDC